MSLLLLYRPVSFNYWYDTGPDPDQLGRNQDVKQPPHFDEKPVTHAPILEALKAEGSALRAAIEKDDEDLILLIAKTWEDFDA